MHRRKPARAQSSINVTPLADVSLSLLLGFLVITPIIFQTLSTKLPQGEESPRDRSGKTRRSSTLPSARS